MIDPSDTSLLRRQADEWDGGRGPRLRDLLNRSPSLRGRREELLDLVYQEIILREQAGETPVPEDYLTLLPDLKDDLQVLFALDQAVQPQPPPPAPADLPRYLVQLGLLSPAETRRYHPNIPIADLLVDLGSRGLLTPYQIERIRDGLATDLVLGGYIVTGVIGRGGMGQVLRGIHRELGRTVAIKVIRNDFIVGTAVVRFQREARAVARLNHPNVVTLFEAALLGPRPYLAMEYVGGRALSKVVEEDGPMPPREALEIVRQAALGLHHAHTQGLVHRDVKPGNIILADTPASPAARIKVLDFGLVALRNGADSLTETGTSLGTPDYMAPEQFSSARLADALRRPLFVGLHLLLPARRQAPFPRRHAMGQAGCTRETATGEHGGSTLRGWRFSAAPTSQASRGSPRECGRGSGGSRPVVYLGTPPTRPTRPAVSRRPLRHDRLSPLHSPAAAEMAHRSRSGAVARRRIRRPGEPTRSKPAGS